MPPLLKLILIRIGLGLLTLFLVSIVVFAATQALPGDTARAILGKEAADKARYEALREQLGLNEPMTTQYLSWLGGVVTGDLGDSLVQDKAVTELLSRRVQNTFVLVLIAALISIPVSLLLGSLTALRRDSKFDVTVTVGSLVAGGPARVRHRHPADPAVRHPGLPPGCRRSRGSTRPVPIYAAARAVHPAGAHADAGGGAVHHPHPARLHDRGARERVRDDGAPQGPAGAPRAQAPRRSPTRWCRPSRSPRSTSPGWPAASSSSSTSSTSPASARCWSTRSPTATCRWCRRICLIIAAVYVLANLTADILTILVSPRLRTGLR